MTQRPQSGRKGRGKPARKLETSFLPKRRNSPAFLMARPKGQGIHPEKYH